MSIRATEEKMLTDEPSNIDERGSDLENNGTARDTIQRNPSFDNLDKDDPATTQARENLKHTTISDKDPLEENGGSNVTEMDQPTVEPRTKMMTPEPSGGQDAEMRERISSPKKKRGREQEDDEARELEAANIQEEAAASPNGTLNGGRTTRLGPEKKRHRDISAEIPAGAGSLSEDDLAQETLDEPKNSPGLDSNTVGKPPDLVPRPAFGTNFSSDKYQTSSSAFAASGFSSLAASPTSGFAALAASRPSVFGSGFKSSLSGFGALAATSTTSTENSTEKPRLGSLVSNTSKSTLSSGFIGVNKVGFSGLGSGFTAGFGGFSSPGPKLTSFASTKPGIIGSEKPAKAFGAPESEDEASEGDESESGSGTSDDEQRSSADDKKKRTGKIPPVPVNDGEEGEATLLQFRVKLYTMESKEAGWKERGIGTLKLNVPSLYIDYDINGGPLLGTFNLPGETNESGPKVARLIMRQEHTLRVILNTPILKGLIFEEKQSSSTTQVLFTAFEDGKPVNMLIKMSEPNAKLLISEIISIQKELGS